MRLRNRYSMKNRLLFIIFLFSFFCYGSVLSAQNHTDESSLQGFSLNMIQKPRAQLLDTMATLCHIYISYDPALIGADELVSVQAEHATLDELAGMIVDQTKVGWLKIDDQLVFFALNRTIEKLSPDSVSFFTIEGKVVDKRDKHPVSYCNISIGKLQIGTVANDEGFFTLKIPFVAQADSICFSCVGYASSVCAIADLKNKIPLEIELRKMSIQLKEIEVLSISPIYILDQFHKQIKKNYENEYCLFTTYYRELVKEKDAFVEISEAVLEVLKSSYGPLSPSDHVKFVKGRKSSDLNDTTLVRLKLKGGPYYINHLDVVKTGETFLDPEYWHLYKYEYAGSKLVDGRKCVVIRFEPIFEEREYLYEGKLYLDLDTKALARAEYALPKLAMKRASSVLVEHRPKGFKAAMLSATYVVQYELNNDKWHLKMARTEMNVRLTNKLENEKYRFQSVSEILTTKISCGELHRFGNNEIFRSDDFVTEKINSFDPVFWENYNVIKPEEALERALEKNDTDKTIEYRLEVGNSF